MTASRTASPPRPSRSARPPFSHAADGLAAFAVSAYASRSRHRSSAIARSAHSSPAFSTGPVSRAANSTRPVSPYAFIALRRTVATTAGESARPAATSASARASYRSAYQNV